MLDIQENSFYNKFISRDADAREVEISDGNPFTKNDSSGDKGVDNAVSEYNNALEDFKNAKTPEDKQKHAALLGEAALNAIEVIEDSDIDPEMKKDLIAQFRDSLEGAKQSNGIFSDNKPVTSDGAAIDAIIDDSLGAFDGALKAFNTDTQTGTDALEAVDQLDEARDSYNTLLNNPPADDASQEEKDQYDLDLQSAKDDYIAALATATTALRAFSIELAADGTSNEYIDDLLSELLREENSMTEVQDQNAEADSDNTQAPEATIPLAV